MHPTTYTWISGQQQTTMTTNFHSMATIVALLLLVLFPLFTQSRNRDHCNDNNQPMYHRRYPNCHHGAGGKAMMHKKEDTMRVAGSSLPNCTHACGSCTPCRLVMVGFVCSSLQEAEACPMAYKCMCHNKSYPVP